ncbi:Glutamate Aspartate periplasmic binding protein precursor GltI (TC 3.A.1.3.4) [Enterobacter hormaechei]|nr:Glutamate Aspartate periplasmic binding protein precursor GltI (TC 3.A.1.3.4) [Enterobacter hormaechei]
MVRQMVQEPNSTKNLNMNFELSDDMKALFKSPKRQSS